MNRHQQTVARLTATVPAGAWAMDPRGLRGNPARNRRRVLRSEVERIVAAAGGQLRTVQDVADAAPFWDAAAAVLVGSDIRELPLRRRAPAVLVGLQGDGDGLWHLAAVHRGRTRRGAAGRGRLAGGIPEPVPRPGSRADWFWVSPAAAGVPGPRPPPSGSRRPPPALGDPGAADRRRPLGRRSGTGAGRRGRPRAPLAGSGRGERQHRPRPA